MRYAIRIVDGATGVKRLFALVNEDNVIKYRNLARKSVTNSDYVTVFGWHLPTFNCYCSDCCVFNVRYPNHWDFMKDWTL